MNALPMSRHAILFSSFTFGFDFLKYRDVKKRSHLTGAHVKISNPRALRCDSSCLASTVGNFESDL